MNNSTFLCESFGNSKKEQYLCSQITAEDIMRRPQIVEQIQQAIHQADPTATAILYGSEARGDARPDSDIDLLILLDGEQRDFRREGEIAGKLYDIELDSGIIISPMIMLRQQWENRPFKTPFYINVMNEGIRL